MDMKMSKEEKCRFDAWVHSPTVNSNDPYEMIIAFKIAKTLSLVPSKVLKALRGGQGPDPETIRRVEAFVENASNLTYVQSPPNRLIKLIDYHS